MFCFYKIENILLLSGEKDLQEHPGIKSFAVLVNEKYLRKYDTRKSFLEYLRECLKCKKEYKIYSIQDDTNY